MGRSLLICCPSGRSSSTPPNGGPTNPANWWTYYGDVSWEEPFVYHSAMDWKGRSMRKEVQHFVRCVAEGKQPLVSGEDGREAVKVRGQGLRVRQARKAG